LLGTWPLQPSGEAELTPGSEYVERIQNYMAKALHEAKLNTSWIQPNEAWDAAMREFVAHILNASPRNKFVPLFLPVAREIARAGAINSLTQTLLKLTSPGVPDIYQGSEIWNYSLVDPDNRRLVDYKQRREMLDSLREAKPEELLQTWPDGRIKMFLIQVALQFRRKNVDLFQRGEYLPLRASGTFAEGCVSFARTLQDQWLVVIAPRLSSRLDFPPVGQLWKDTMVDLPPSLVASRVQEIFAGRELAVQANQIRLNDALSVLPFSAITNIR
ncbi:MAG: malto-oligosyltrehalose synthase, partial [Chthoniobacterales bacterium]